jgi:hypothetical protein
MFILAKYAYNTTATCHFSIKKTKILKIKNGFWDGGQKATPKSTLRPWHHH